MIIKEGLKYYREGRIKQVYIGDKLISFLIQGTTGKHTVIFDFRLRKYSCSCWGFTVHKRCKHVFCALAYLKDNHPDLYKKVEEVFRLSL